MAATQPNPSGLVPGENFNGSIVPQNWYSMSIQEQQQWVLQATLNAPITGPPTDPNAYGNVPLVGPIIKTSTSLEQFLGYLSQPQTWARIGEGLLGVVVIGIGIYALTKGDNSGRRSTVGKIASQQLTFAGTSNIRNQQRANASSRAYETSAARVRGRGDAAVDTAGKKAYATAYNRKMGQRDASLARIIR